MKRREREAYGYLLEAAEASLTARVIINCFLAELYYLPYLYANSLAEKIFIERDLNQTLNLERARREGVIKNWTIIWKTLDKSNWPQQAIRIRIYVPSGTQLRDHIPEPLIEEINRVRAVGLNSLRIPDS